MKHPLMSRFSERTEEMGMFCRSFLLHLKEQCIVRAFLRLSAAILGLLIVGFVLLFAVASLPDARLASNITAASKAEYFSTNYPTYFFMRSLDMFTECIGIGMAKELQPTLQNILSASHFGECEGLRAAVENNFSSGARIYPRYIHGYQIILKSLYTFLPIEGVRIVTAAVSLLLLAALFFTARYRLGSAYASLVVAPFLLFVRSPHVFLLVTHAVQFWVVLAGCIAALLHTKSNAPIVLFGLIGACDAFMSFLNMGSLSLGMPILCFCLARWSDGSAPALILAQALWAGIAWSFGFLIPWCVKWGLVLAILPTGTDIFGQTLEIYPARSFGMIRKALFNNFKATRWQLWAGLFVLLAVRIRKYKTVIPQRLWVILFAALVPLVWVCLLPGQSGVSHSRFVHIIVLPLLTSVLCLLVALPPKAESLKPLIRRGHERPKFS